MVAQAFILSAATSSGQTEQTPGSPAQTEATSGDAQSPSGAGNALQGGRRPAGPSASGVGEVLKMLDAGVSPEVIRVFIETSSRAVNVSGADVIALKKHGATDDLITVLLTRSAQARARATEARERATAVALRGAASSAIGMDPEGYDYFQYYYLYPRTLASAYGQLGYYGMPAFGYGFSPGFGYGYSRGFGGGFPSRYGNSRRLGFRNNQLLR